MFQTYLPTAVVRMHAWKKERKIINFFFIISIVQVLEIRLNEATIEWSSTPSISTNGSFYLYILTAWLEYFKKIDNSLVFHLF